VCAWVCVCMCLRVRAQSCARARARKVICACVCVCNVYIYIHMRIGILTNPQKERERDRERKILTRTHINKFPCKDENRGHTYECVCTRILLQKVSYIVGLFWRKEPCVTHASTEGWRRAFSRRERTHTFEYVYQNSSAGRILYCRALLSEKILRFRDLSSESMFDCKALLAGTESLADKQGDNATYIVGERGHAHTNLCIKTLFRKNPIAGLFWREQFHSRIHKEITPRK